MSVRLAKMSELSDILAYARTAHEKSNYADFPFNSVVARRTLKSAMTDANSRVWIAEHEGRICGLLIGEIGDLPMTHFQGATDLVFVADRHGEKLLDAFVAWCKLRKVARIDMGISAGPDREVAVRRMFERVDFLYSGQMFHQNMPGVA